MSYLWISQSILTNSDILKQTGISLKKIDL